MRKPKLTWDAWWLYTSLRFCPCLDCYGRFLFRERSWSLVFHPVPFPEFYFHTYKRGWRICVGWFLLTVYRKSSNPNTASGGGK